MDVVETIGQALWRCRIEGQGRNKGLTIRRKRNQAEVKSCVVGNVALGLVG